MQQTGSNAVLYDLTEMEPTSVHVLLYQRILNDHVRQLDLRRAIVVPNTQIAHLARLAFGVGDYKLFYDDRMPPGGSCATRARSRAPTGAFA
jgi:hypothetical protein